MSYIDLRGTTHSREHDEIMKKHRLDRHTALIYIIALKEHKQQPQKFLPLGKNTVPFKSIRKER